MTDYVTACYHQKDHLSFRLTTIVNIATVFKCILTHKAKTQISLDCNHKDKKGLIREIHYILALLKNTLFNIEERIVDVFKKRVLFLAKDYPDLSDLIDTLKCQDLVHISLSALSSTPLKPSQVVDLRILDMDSALNISSVIKRKRLIIENIHLIDL